MFRRYQKTAEPIPLKAAFAALTSDIITESCFATQENYIEAPDFNAIVLAASEGATDNLHLVLQFKWIVPVVKKLPDKAVVMLLGPGMALLHQFQRVSLKAAWGKDTELETDTLLISTARVKSRRSSSLNMTIK